MTAVPTAILLLTASNVFMAFAWYAHLKSLSASPWHAPALCIVAAVYFVFRKAA